MGLLAGPVVGVAIYLALGDAADLTEPGRRLAGVAVLMAIWWVSEAVPLSATALIPIVAFPVLGVLPVEDTTARYAHKLIFLFMGGLMLGVGLQRWDAHKRLALLIILLVGTGPRRIVAGIMLSSGILSAFVSNTATTMMMLPIVLAVGALAIGDNDETTPHARRYYLCLLLALAYGANLGGVATITGTPPNGLLAGFMTQEMGIEMTYARWLALGVPLASVMLPIAWGYLVFIAAPVRIDDAPGGRRYMRERLRELGPMSRAEITAVAIFSLTALAWVFHGVIEDRSKMPPIDDASIAIGGAVLMFIAPSGDEEHARIISWRDAERIPWGILILFGGGLALAKAVTHSGLDAWIGGMIAAMGSPGELPLIGGVTVLIGMLTNITSNTATTSTMLPVLSAVGDGLGVDATLLVIAAAVSSSCAFILPIATPPNAIVFSSGRIGIAQMARAGVGLNLIATLVITLMVWGLARPLLGL